MQHGGADSHRFYPREAGEELLTASVGGDGSKGLNVTFNHVVITAQVELE
jgi:hypothetical protein